MVLYDPARPVAHVSQYGRKCRREIEQIVKWTRDVFVKHIILLIQ